MYSTTPNGLEYLFLETPPFDEILNGFFTRKGGVSPEPYNSLNLSTSTGDHINHVRQNRNLIFNAIHKPLDSIYEVWQVHSDNIICTDEPLKNRQELIKADAIFTSNPNITLLMRFADCVPILIYDPIKKIVGIIHAGWQGTINQIASKSILTLNEKYGSNPNDIYAAIGPSICPDHYEVGDNVFMLADDLFNGNREIAIKQDGKRHFSLWKANEELLRDAGVKQITQTKVCTAGDTARWYSHRAEAGKTGRFATVISLTKVSNLTENLVGYNIDHDNT